MKPTHPCDETSVKYLLTAQNWLFEKLNLSLATKNASHDAVNQAYQQMIDARSLHPLPALIYLCSTLKLNEFEHNILLLCLCFDLFPQFPPLYAQLQQNSLASYPTFGLAVNLFEHPNWESLVNRSPLRTWQLIDILHKTRTPLMNCPLKINEGILHYCLGRNSLEQRPKYALFPFTRVKDSTDKQESSSLLSDSQRDILDQILMAFKNTYSNASSICFNLLGENITTKHTIIEQICQDLGLSLHRLIVEQIPTNSEDLRDFITFWQRENLLLPLALYIDLQYLERIPSNSDSLIALRRFFMSCHGVFFLDSLDVFQKLDVNLLTFDIPKPTPEEQYQFWSQLLGQDKEQEAYILTSQFNLNSTDIQQIYSKTTNFNENNLLNSLWQNCLAHTIPKMDNLAQRIELKATWDDLVLPDQITEQLRQIVAQIRFRHQVYDEWGYRRRLNRGLGVATVFAGQSGTGKTMAAEVIANDLQLNLYRIDLSAVVSKYIGETEKNLRKLFDAAEEGGCILFFDEADALFGKRSEVKDSHDRYANIEINYLLQRLESYNGLAILATNKKGSMDGAFMRRLRFIIDFPFPNREIRQQLWKKVFPPQAPVDDLDYNYLKLIQLTGGSIQNVAINASFLAAKNGNNITMNEVMSALKSEFMKLERPLNELNIKPSNNQTLIQDNDEEWDD
ncbi:MAG: ATP-binding protein [Microcystaceae cyanobacterium]